MKTKNWSVHVSQKPETVIYKKSLQYRKEEEFNKLFSIVSWTKRHAVDMAQTASHVYKFIRANTDEIYKSHGLAVNKYLPEPFQVDWNRHQVTKQQLSLGRKVTAKEKKEMRKAQMLEEWLQVFLITFYRHLHGCRNGKTIHYIMDSLFEHGLYKKLALKKNPKLRRRYYKLRFQVRTTKDIYGDSKAQYELNKVEDEIFAEARKLCEEDRKKELYLYDKEDYKDLDITVPEEKKEEEKKIKMHKVSINY